MIGNEIKNFELTTDTGYKLKGNIKYPFDKGNLPIVVIMHGFKAFKNWGFFPYISSQIASAGAIAVCFDFSLNGIVDEASELFDADRFSRNTISRELADAMLVLSNIDNGSLVANTGIEDRFNGNIYLLGHSLGGAIAILTAREFLISKRLNDVSNHSSSLRNVNIKKLALWATISHFDRYTKRQKLQWRRQGFMEFVNNSTGQLLKMNVSYLEDIEENSAKFSLTQTVNNLKIPILIVHGDKDVTVPIKEGIELAKCVDKEFLKFIKLKNTGHIFGIEHPLKSVTVGLNRALEETLRFFGLR